MAESPQYKVYTAAGEYEAACKHAEIAAAVVGVLGDGATVRYQHGSRLWTEGKDGKAGESYDRAAAVINQRLAELHERSYRDRQNHTQITMSQALGR
jgi:hypothetical protein